jgi:hypothetical protein
MSQSYREGFDGCPYHQDVGRELVPSPLPVRYTGLVGDWRNTAPRIVATESESPTARLKSQFDNGKLKLVDRPLRLHPHLMRQFNAHEIPQTLLDLVVLPDRDHLYVGVLTS